MSSPLGACLILLVGEVGSGKSRFARELTQDSTIEVSESLVSGTSY